MQLLASSHTVFFLVSSVKEDSCLLGKQIHLFSFSLSPPVLYLSASVGGSQFVVNVHSQFLQIPTFIFTKAEYFKMSFVSSYCYFTSDMRNTKYGYCFQRRNNANQKNPKQYGTKPTVLEENVTIWISYFFIVKLFPFIADLRVACGY